MAAKRPVGLGILGVGRAGHGMHCGELEGAKLLGSHFEIVAACDTHKPWRERMGERFSEAKIYTKIEDLLSDEAVELVSIATRSCDHYEHARAALKAGKHVFLEKPICMSYAEAKRLAAYAEKTKGKLYVRHNRRFDPDFLHICEIIASGILGDVFHIKLARPSYSRRDDWQTIIKYGGGQLLNWGPHVIDHALQFLGAPAKPVASMWSDLKRIAAAGDAEDHVKIAFKGASGLIVDAEISGGAAIGLPTFLVWGTKGALSCSGKTITLKYLDPKKKLKPRKADPGVPGAGFGSKDELPWKEETCEVAPKRTFNIWELLYQSIRNRKAFPIKIDEALEVMRVISAAKKGTPFEPKPARKKR